MYVLVLLLNKRGWGGIVKKFQVIGFKKLNILYVQRQLTPARVLAPVTVRCSQLLKTSVKFLFNFPCQLNYKNNENIFYPELYQQWQQQMSICITWYCKRNVTYYSVTLFTYFILHTHTHLLSVCCRKYSTIQPIKKSDTMEKGLCSNITALIILLTCNFSSLLILELLLLLWAPPDVAVDVKYDGAEIRRSQ